MTKAERCHQAYLHDAALWRAGQVFAGLDEAGRGPLAGCVVAACVVMRPEPEIPYVYDSKQLTAKQREKAFALIRQHAAFIGIGQVEAEEIDQINILQATRQAMQQAAQGAPAKIFLVDALTRLGLPGEERAIIQGDAVSYSIAAASIIAKVTRDRLMERLDAQYPQYGFARNKGYGTAEHLAALRAQGPSPAHRLSFLHKILA
ncbi:MAG: ribonuclease HII [Clostridiales bacterium]|nr:ribonuclease HII [Clostridiales bacterium]